MRYTHVLKGFRAGTNPFAKIGDKGQNQVREQVDAHTHWMCRFQDLDYVVDLEAEYAPTEGDGQSPAGKLLKLQVKATESADVRGQVVHVVFEQSFLSYLRPAAEAVRSFLLLRLRLHLGLHQKNLRQLMLCPRVQMPRPVRVLEKLKRGEIRWSDRDGGWEVLIPAVAFKNAHSSFFGDKPFRLVLPELLDLYRHINGYVELHRLVLLRGVDDPGTFFVKAVKTASIDVA